MQLNLYTQTTTGSVKNVLIGKVTWLARTFLSEIKLLESVVNVHIIENGLIRGDPMYIAMDVLHQCYIN